MPSLTPFTLPGQDLAEFFDVVVPHLNERQRRIVTGAMARTLGYGGVKAVAEASGIPPFAE